MRRVVNVAIVGGSGFWSETNHYNHLLKMQASTPIKIVGIIDYVDPRTVTTHPRLQQVLAADSPLWINPSDFASEQESIDALSHQCGVDLVIIASSPCTHFAYGKACIARGIHVICDKPIVSVNDAAISIDSARAISEQYDELRRMYGLALQKNPHLLFHSILRRRGLSSFIHIGDNLEAVYKDTGAGINQMTVIVNGGKYEFPEELKAPGAHGYLDGVGSISHSAYHYIDLIAWYMCQAPGDARYLRPRLNYVYRVSDYLKTKNYTSLAKLLGDDAEVSAQLHPISESILGSELNSSYTFDILDAKKNLIGNISFIFNHVSFTPRTLRYNASIREPADNIGGGRMSQVIIDIHQSGLQNWQLTKNDVVFAGNTVSTTCRRHPLIVTEYRPALEKIDEDNAYETGTTLYEALRQVIESISSGQPINTVSSTARSLTEESLTTKLYASCYQLLAANYEAKIAPDILLEIGDNQ